MPGASHGVQGAVQRDVTEPLYLDLHLPAGSRFEQVFQDLDTVIALYDIPPGTRFPHINGFFSKDLADVTQDPSGWIFARGGNAYLAYRPLAAYRWIKYLHYTGGWAKERLDLGGQGTSTGHHLGLVVGVREQGASLALARQAGFQRREIGMQIR